MANDNENIFDAVIDQEVPAMPGGHGAGVALVPAAVPAQLESTRASYASYMQALAGRQRPDEKALIERAIWVGRMMGQAGYYSFPVGGKRAEGLTIKMAEALRDQWGSTALDCWVEKVEGSTVFLQAQMTDFLSCNVTSRPYVATLSAPPGKFARDEEQSNRWRVMQLQNAVSKAVRGAIDHALPKWFTAPAFGAAKGAALSGILKDPKTGKDITIEQARDAAVGAFASLKVSKEEVEALVGRTQALWVDLDILMLRETYGAIKQGEATVDGIFAEVRAQRRGQEQAGATGAAALGVKPQAAK